MDKNSIIYEQPLNEHIRVCLRLEYLFKKVRHHLNGDSTWDSHDALVAIMEILNVLDRADIKSKLYNALRHHITTLAHLSKLPEIDQDKLHNTIEQLEQYADLLHNTHGKLGQSIRDNDFLATIRQKLVVAGGTTDFAIPAYHLWLHQPIELRKENLHTWFAKLEQVDRIVELLLQLTRDRILAKTKIAENGFYQENLDAEASYQMVRVILPSEVEIYPRISVGRHRLSIHFFQPNIEARPTQVTNDVEFGLICCKI